MKNIYKYTLGNQRGIVCVPIVANAEILTVQCQRGEVVLWALVPMERVAYQPYCPPVLSMMNVQRFYLYFTGDTVFDDNLEFIATVQLPDGIVIHVFGEGRK